MPALLDAYQRSRNVRDRIAAALIRRSFAAWGRRTVVRLPLRVEGADRIELGAGVFVGAGSWLHSHAGGRIRIGDGCRFAGFAVISAAVSIEIEDDVLMARNVHVLDHHHRFDRLDVPVHAQGVAGHAPVRIRRGAWIGANAVVLPGVTIGRNAVIGANSVVREDVPDFGVAAGAPAQVVHRTAPVRAADGV
jgi:acetyltransferase-like isoleucine patch superfamily enzyme